MSRLIRIPWGSGIKPPVGSKLNRGHPLAQGLVICDLVNENGGGKLYDIASKQHGLFVNNPTWSAGNLNFNGTTTYVDHGNNPITAPAALTYIVWVKFASLSNAYTAAISKVQGPTAFYSSILVKSTGKLASYVQGATSSGTLSYDGTGAYTLTTGVWYQLAISVSAVVGGNATLTGYVNGNVDASVTGTFGGMGGTGVLTVGTDTNTAGRYLNGNVDQVRVYNRAVPASQLKWLYQERYADIQRQLGPITYIFPAAASATIFNRRSLGGRVGSRSS